MIYLVSNEQTLFQSSRYKPISLEESIEMIKDCKRLQFDSETSGLDCRLDTLLSIQLGNKEKDFQIVVDCTTIDIKAYKPYLESIPLIGHNLKFDLQWLYNYNIVPRKVYDTMIVEQLLYLSFPSILIDPNEYVEEKYDFPYTVVIDKDTGMTYYRLSFSLKSIAKKRLGIDMDKTVRGEIIYKGLNEATIIYSATDVMYLEDLYESQIRDCRVKNCLVGAKLECDVVPAMAYLEWCGIKLDVEAWKKKMKDDQLKADECLKKLNDYIISKAKTDLRFNPYVSVNLQGSLFDDDLNGSADGFYDTAEKCNINWSSPSQLTKICKLLGFDVITVNKKTGEDTESVIEKQLTKQKGIDDYFVEVYIGYRHASKRCSSFGQGHINAINPKTGRIHTVYRQIGTISSRMSCGSTEPNTALAKALNIPPKECKYPNFQQLPHDALTRSCFISEPQNLFCSCDYSAAEARIGADVYNEKYLLDEFLVGSGDTHAAYAKAVFTKELEGIDTKDVKEKRPDLRNKVKSIEFAVSQ